MLNKFKFKLKILTVEFVFLNLKCEKNWISWAKDKKKLNFKYKNLNHILTYDLIIHYNVEILPLNPILPRNKIPNLIQRHTRKIQSNYNTW